MVPTFRDAPWERDERKRREDALPPKGQDKTVPAAVRTVRQSGSRPHTPQQHRITLASAGQLLVVVAVLVFAAQVFIDRSRSESSGAVVVPASPTPAPLAAAPAAEPSPKPDLGSVIELKSRALNGTLEVWGTTDAADGASVGLLVRTPGGSWTRLPDMPASGGRFFGRNVLPQHLSNRRLQLRSRIRS